MASRIARGVRAGIVATLLLGCSGNVLAQSSRAAEDKPENYPEGPHREGTFYFCTACHSFKLVAQQGMTRLQWDDTLNWMQERHALPKTEGKDRENLLDYLSSAFPQRQKPGWQNPFAK